LIEINFVSKLIKTGKSSTAVIIPVKNAALLDDAKKYQINIKEVVNDEQNPTERNNAKSSTFIE
jgi:hypothetical protein